MIPDYTDIVVTHEPPVMILDESNGVNWGNAPLRNRVQEIKPKYHFLDMHMTAMAQISKKALSSQMEQYLMIDII